LNAKNKIKTTEALNVPVLRYSFGIINCKLEEIRKIDRKTKKVLTMYKMHHSIADIDYIRKGGGRVLLQIEITYKAEIINTAEYFNTKYAEDQFINSIKSHKSTQPNMNSTIKVAANTAEELNQLNENSDTKQEGIQHIKAKLGESLKKILESKVTNGQCIRNTDRQLISKEDKSL
jgi:hypothetical protein